MNHLPITTTILFLIPVLFIVAFLYPSPGMVMAMMMVTGFLVIIQVLSVLMSDETEEEVQNQAIDKEIVN